MPTYHCSVAILRPGAFVPGKNDTVPGDYCGPLPKFELLGADGQPMGCGVPGCFVCEKKIPRVQPPL